jgi:hypothetical protein
MSTSTDRFLEKKTGNQWNIEAVFQPESLRFFSGDFRPFSCAFSREMAGILLPFYIDFRSFLPDSVAFPAFFSGIRSASMAGIIELGFYRKISSRNLIFRTECK